MVEVVMFVWVEMFVSCWGKIDESKLLVILLKSFRVSRVFCYVTVVSLFSVGMKKILA